MGIASPKTLHDAGHYAAAFPRALQERAEWQTAAEMLILAAQDQRPVTFADIAMRRALHAGEAERSLAPNPEFDRGSVSTGTNSTKCIMELKATHPQLVWLKGLSWITCFSLIE